MVRASYAIADDGMGDEFRCDQHDGETPCYRTKPINPVRVVRHVGGRMEYTEEYRKATKDQAWSTLVAMGEWDRSTNVLSNCLMLGLCPMGMIGEDLSHYLNLEMVCETYKAPPVDGGVDNWPALVYDAFLAIRQAHEAIKGEKAREMRIKRRSKTGR